MTDDRDTEPDDEGDEVDADDPTAEDVFGAMEPFEPYTAGELASRLGAPTGILRRLLARLAGEDRVRRKELTPDPDRRRGGGRDQGRPRVVWVREPPRQECPDCGGEFEVRYFHPVLQAVQYCPRCGTRLRTRR